MKLTHVQITTYRCIDSTEFTVQPDVTCLVGKNESGKTTVLHALWHLKPDQKMDFDVTQDYPRVALNQYQKRHEANPDVVVTASFDLEPEDVASIEKEFGAGALDAKSISVSRDYKNVLKIPIAVNERAHLAHWLTLQPALDEDIASTAKAATTFANLLERLAQHAQQQGLADTKKAAIQKLTEAAKQAGAKPLVDLVAKHIEEKCLPAFMYFGDYDVMKGAAELAQLKADAALSDPGLRTLRALLELAGITPAELDQGGRYEDHKARLESTGNSITDEAFTYWTQNQDLEVEFDVAPLGPKDRNYRAPAQGQLPPTWLQLRVKNRRHRVTVPFDERSKGFVWFFSFLARFNQIASAGKHLILLLDEPGLSLHGTAQEDFLRLINDRLAGKGYQVIYTTHSPFMVEPNHLDRVRTVEDVATKGTIVSSDCLRTDAATSFPLQAALGYSIAQTLFVGPNCLLVEGPSDLIYLQVLSELVARSGSAGLDDRWVIVPVGGAGRLAAFATLLRANKLNVAVLMDFDSKEQQRIDHILETGLLNKARIVSLATFAGAATACDIEDLLGVTTYLELVNDAYGLKPPMKEQDLPPGDRVTKRVERALRSRGVNGWNHFKPSQSALRLLPSLKLPSDVVARFAHLFAKLNSFLPN